MTGRQRSDTILLVEADDAERDRFGGWLEDEGFNVLTCPGPSEPDYTCVGTRTVGCALATAASIVVLDMSTRSEGVVMGTTSEELLALYLYPNGRVVVLGSHPGEEIGGRLVRLRRHPARGELVDAVRSLVGRGPDSSSHEGPSAPA